jgi:hypothetical protein
MNTNAVKVLELAITEMKELRASVTSCLPTEKHRVNDDVRAISIAITEAETALLWLKSVVS